MQLLTGPLSMFGTKAEIAAREKGLTFERVMVSFDRDDRYQPRHPEVLRINPKQQVPVLIDGAVEIFDSTQARRLEHLSDEVFFPNVIRLFGLQDAMQSAPVGQRPAVRALVEPMMKFPASQGRPVPAFLQSHLAP